MTEYENKPWHKVPYWEYDCQGFLFVLSGIRLSEFFVCSVRLLLFYFLLTFHFCITFRLYKLFFSCFLCELAL